MTEAVRRSTGDASQRRVRIVFLAVFAVASLTVWITNRLLSERFIEDTRGEAELQVTLNSGNLMAELRQNRIVPQLLSRDPELIDALVTSNFSGSTQRLMTFQEETGVASLMLLDLDGRSMASTDRNRLGTQHSARAYFVEALRAPDTIFTVERRETGGYAFVYSRRVVSGSVPLGVILVEVDLQKFERAWSGIAEAFLVLDSAGTVILSTRPQWRGSTEEAALAAEQDPGAFGWARRLGADWSMPQSDTYLQDEPMIRLETRVPFRGWRMVSYTSFATVRERVNGVLALEIMVFAILLALAFYAQNRKSADRASLFARESAELRTLNQQLQQEIAERLRVQESLAVAEQTLEQSSKLAALGEMSAAVSHELNQPLAAMKTYLAGAKLLLRRNRPDEALSAFRRIDDLIERMGMITRQLKSYARKGQAAWSPVNMQDALASSLAMMEPQLRQREVLINRNFPREPVEVLGDQLRIEQVMINLLRNALDATKSQKEARIDIILAAGESAVVTIRDNGPGIENKNELFEPFYTTKQPGDGVGLGLAISSGIVNELGGRLRARNGQKGGAVFEVHLPIHENGLAGSDVTAAE